MEALSRLPVDNVVFPKLGIDLTINSEAISIFGFSVKWYGVMIALGMLLAMMYCFRRAKEYGIDGDRLIDAVIAGVIGAVVGARLYYVVLHSASYHSIKDILSIRDGGLAIYGGIIGGLLFGCIMAKIRKLKIMPTLDIVAMGLFIGQCLGRWGNFFNQEAYGGAITDQAWQFFPYGVYIDNPTPELSGAIYHWHQATFFYEFALNLIGFFVLFYLSNKYYKQKPGLIVCGYFVWYGLTRAVVEPLRSDSLYMGTFRVSQLLSFLLIAAGCILALMILWEKLSRYERGCGILACGCAVLFTLLWTLAEIISGFEFETYAAMTCLCLSVAVIGIVCAVLERRRLYLITGGALLLLGSLFLWGWGVTPYVIIAGAVLLIACVCVSFLFPRKPSEFDEEEVEGAEEAPVEENHE